MNDGTYRVTKADSSIEVVEVFRNHCRLGPVHKLVVQDSCIFEAVEVLTRSELERRIQDGNRRSSNPEL